MNLPLSWADHRLFETKGKTVLFGVDDASLFSLDAEAAETLRKWRAEASLVLDEVSLPDREVLEGLAEARILRPEGWGGEKRQPRLDPRDVPVGTLVLEVAQACNLRCTYCYAEGGSYGHAPRLLSPETARRAVRHLLEESGDRESVTLIFFGGEPLLNMEAVKAATNEAHTLGGAMGKKVHLSLTTNGTLLDAETVAFLHENRVSVSVSMDGPQSLHDKNRPDARGRGTYAQIVSRLGMLLDHPPVPVGGRVTLPPEQWERVVEVFDHMMDLGFHEVGIAPASPITRELLPTPSQEEALLAGFRTLAGRFLGAAREGRMYPFGNILDLVGRLHVGRTKSLSCGAGYGYLAVDADGAFFPCHRLAGAESFRVGDLDAGPDPDRVSACLSKLDEGREEACAGCWARTLCRGGCHYENHVRENVLLLPRGTGCDFIRGWLETGIETYAALRADGISEKMGRRLEMRASC